MTVLLEHYVGETEKDELELVKEFEEGFDRVDFKAEFSPSPNLEGPQPRDNVSRDNGATVSSSPPRARIDSENGKDAPPSYIIGSLLWLTLPRTISVY